MKLLIWLVTIFGLVSLGSPLTAGPISLADFHVTNICIEHLNKQGITSFEMWDDDPADPILVNRNPDKPVKITNIWFVPSVYGWLIEVNKQKVVHCHREIISFVNFSVAEQRQRYFMFDQGPYNLTEVHLHSFVGCGTSCHFARVETIIFFDKETQKPIYDHVEDAYPNEYPSSWYRALLTSSEKHLFDELLQLRR
jgi:hypothetical protein